MSEWGRHNYDSISKLTFALDTCSALMYSFSINCFYTSLIREGEWGFQVEALQNHTPRTL